MGNTKLVDTVNLSLHPTAGCCHLGNLMTDATAIARLFLKFRVHSNCFPAMNSSKICDFLFENSLKLVNFNIFFKFVKIR